MSIMTWIREHLRCGKSVERADTAIGMADEVAKEARSLTKQLEPFSKDRDPFHAVFTKQRIANDYERSIEFEQTPRART